jgi:hypothetical protein
MKCKLDIKKGIVEKAISRYDKPDIKKIGENRLFIGSAEFRSPSTTAEKIKNEINEEFNSELAFVKNAFSGQEVVVEPNEQLIDEYYDLYSKRFNKLTTALTGIDEFGDSDTNAQDLYNRSLQLSADEIEERIKQCE